MAVTGCLQGDGGNGVYREMAVTGVYREMAVTGYLQGDGGNRVSAGRSR